MKRNINTSLTPVNPNLERNLQKEYLPPLLCRYVKSESSKNDFFVRDILGELGSKENPLAGMKGVDFGVFRLNGEGKPINAVTYLANPSLENVPDEYSGVLDTKYAYGIGGNITGFLDLMDIKRTGDLKNMYNSFGAGKDLIVILTPILQLTTNFPFFYSSGDLKDTVVPCENMVKVARLGTLMPNANQYEWNFITNQCVELPAVRIKSPGWDVTSYLPPLNRWVIEGGGFYELPSYTSSYDKCPNGARIMNENRSCNKPVTNTTSSFGRNNVSSRSSNTNVDMDMNGGRKNSKTRKVLKKKRKTQKSKTSK